MQRRRNIPYKRRDYHDNETNPHIRDRKRDNRQRSTTWPICSTSNLRECFEMLKKKRIDI